MQVQPITNQNNYKIQFRGTVSPEFVQYVNELRQDCLKTATKSKAEQINKVCDDILKKSTDVMEKCFHPLSVLTINKTKWTRCDTIEIPSIMAKYTEGHTPSACFIPIKGQRNPQERLDILSKFINSNFTFIEAFAQELFAAQGVVYLLSQSRNNSYIIEGANDTINLLKFWQEHISLLPESKQHNKPEAYSKAIPGLIQEFENLKKTSEETSKENK